MRVPEQFVSLHTYSGKTLGQLSNTEISSVVWSRAQRESGRLELSFVTAPNADLSTGLVPWAHWVSAWDDRGELLWTGPILKVVVGNTTTVTARDVSALFGRTRVPIGKTWATSDPASIAAELWRAAAELHSLAVAPIVRGNAGLDIFTYTAVPDVKLLSAVIDDLVKLGLRWTVVSGTPVFGPMPADPVALLTSDDFTADVQVVRDGTAAINDIRLQGKNWAANARAELADLNLQGIVSIDDLAGVSNIERAAAQYVGYTASIRESVSIPGSTVLNARAPIELEDLIPGRRLVIEARERAILVELENLSVRTDANGTTVEVSLESVPDVAPELAAKASATGSLGL